MFERSPVKTREVLMTTPGRSCAASRTVADYTFELTWNTGEGAVLVIKTNTGEVRIPATSTEEITRLRGVMDWAERRLGYYWWLNEGYGW